MSESWENLLAQIIEKEKSILDEIYKCSKQKTDYIVKGNVEKISKIVSREQTLSLMLETSEKKRLDLLRKNRMAGKTLREICGIAVEEYKEVLESELESLTGAIQKVRQTNDLNAGLTKSRLEFYGKLRALYSQPVYGYGKKNSDNGSVGHSLIDRSV